jgi:hypothetical protein
MYLVDSSAQPPSSSPEPVPGPARVDPSQIRASDADRDRVADALREALAEGRLTPEEHAERIDLVYRAKTYAELEPILADLPSASSPRPAPVADPGLPMPDHQSSNIVAIFGGAERKGRWLVEPHTNITTVCGGVELDFREAVLSQQEVTINISCIMGGISIKIPPGVRVVSSVAAILGGIDHRAGDDTVDVGAPVLRLTGFVLMGGVEIKRRLPKGAKKSGRHHGAEQIEDDEDDRRLDLRHRRLDRHQEIMERRREIQERRREMREDRRERREERRYRRGY